MTQLGIFGREKCWAERSASFHAKSASTESSTASLWLAARGDAGLGVAVELKLDVAVPVAAAGAVAFGDGV